MADRRLSRKTSRYAPYVTATPRRSYESNDHDESNFSENASIREHGETTRRLEEEESSSVNAACFPKMLENSRDDASVSSSTYPAHRSSVTESSNSSKQRENAVPRREECYTGEYVDDDEAYFSDNDFLDFLDNSASSDEEGSSDDKPDDDKRRRVIQ